MTYRIGVGGVRGTGKTQLRCNLLDFFYHLPLELGFHRSIMRETARQAKAHELFESVMSAATLGESLHRLYAQARLLQEEITALVKTYHEVDARTPVVVTGTHVVPGIFVPERDFDLQVLLVASPQTLEQRIRADLKPRNKSQEALRRNAEVQEHLIQEARKYQVQIIDAELGMHPLSEILARMPKEYLPR